MKSSTFKKVRLFVIENRYAFISFFILAFICLSFFITFFNFSGHYLNEINQGNYENITAITNNLFDTYFSIILYASIFIVCAVVFVGRQLAGNNDYRLLLILWYLVLFLFSKVNDINVNITTFQHFINMISDSLYELSTIPLLLYVILKMKENSKYMQFILLMECLSSLFYVIGYTVPSSNVFSIFKNISCSAVFVVTVLVIHIFSSIEIRHKNVDLKKFLLIELGIVTVFSVISIAATIFGTSFYDTLYNGLWELVTSFNLLPLRKAAIQDIIAISVFIDYCLIAFRKYIEGVEKNKSIETELLLAEGYNEIAQVRIREVRKLKHDIKEHINVAYAYCKANERDKLISYLEALGAQTAALPSLAYCNNVPCNHILMFYSQKAKDKGIRFTATTQTGENIGISDSEATSLMSNLLKNAYEACLTYLEEGNEKAYINFSMSIRNNKIHLFCENSCLSEAKKDNKGKFKTTKSNALEHGLGIAIVESICEKHNGAAIFDMVGNKFTVNATIPVEL